MDPQQSRQEENKEMFEMRINEFMATARYYLLGMAPPQAPALATIPVRQDDRR